MNQYTEADLIRAARSASEQQEHSLSRSDFERISGISQHHIYRLFPDGGRSALEDRAGLEKHPSHHVQLDDNEILKEFHAVASELGRVPTWAQFNSRAQISSDVLRRRFAGRLGVLTRYKAWLEEHEPQSPLLAGLGESNDQVPLPTNQTKTASPEPASVWAKGHGPRYGAPINFRGLRHAPLNEYGVVFLFGMVSRDLDFLVEAAHASFPDCDAKRLVDRKKDLWERVRIEFEFKSRNFKDHGHDPPKCDLIVCWEHNWPECPIEVVELKAVIEKV